MSKLADPHLPRRIVYWPTRCHQAGGHYTAPHIMDNPGTQIIALSQTLTKWCMCCWLCRRISHLNTEVGKEHVTIIRGNYSKESRSAALPPTWRKPESPKEATCEVTERGQSESNVETPHPLFSLAVSIVRRIIGTCASAHYSSAV